MISDPATGEIFVPNINGQPGFSRQPADTTTSTYTSLNTGMVVTQIGGTNPAAQTVELDIPVTLMHQPVSSAYVRVWGISLAEIAQSANLNGMNIAVYGGMAQGLPLANPAQSGLLAGGQILQAFGNWVNNDQSLDIYMFYGGSSPTSNQTTGNPSTTATTPTPTTNDAPANLTFQWKQGQDFISTVATPLMGIFPKYKIEGAVNPNLVWSSGQAVTGFFNTLNQFAQFLNDLSQKIIGGYAPDTKTYPGVCLTLQNNTISIFDGSTQTHPKQIQFLDLIGQPTWGQPFQVQVTCVMRADLSVGDYVTLPASPGVISSGSQSQFYNPIGGNQYASLKSGTVFTGTFQVVAVRHIGNSRQPAAQAWITTIDLIQVSTSQSTVDELPVLYNGNNAYNFTLPS